ncbi:hypothetical protein G9P44_002050 [Scheffersomyces stipitis]|nr:hypothetical protein G9P44_002050 [Scheffersomyces stipitis]
MWPHKKGLGIRLSYGVDGNGQVRLDASHSKSSKDGDEDESSKSPAIRSRVMATTSYARCQEDEVVLHEVSKSVFELARSSTSSFTLNSRMYDNLEVAIKPIYKKNLHQSEVSEAYVPDNILNSYLIESKTLTSTIAYDPNYENLFALFKVQMKGSSQTFRSIAYVSGESGNILNIGLVNSKGIEARNKFNKESFIKLLIPELSRSFQISLSEPIKQIEIAREVFDYTPSYIVVRTSSKVYVLFCRIPAIQTKSLVNLEVSVLGCIESKDLACNELAHVSVNPYDFSRFAVIDIKGHFGLWTISFDSVKKFNMDSSQCSPSLEDCTELSNWKRIQWIYDSNHLVVLTRASVTQFTVSPKLQSRRLITSNTWSRIQDFATLGESSFLLTSKELIWFKSESTMTRLMSWKHFLDDSDPSLRFQVTETKQERRYCCLIYSQVYSLIFVYNFAYRDGKPFSLHDPYYLRREGSKADLRQVALMDISREFYYSNQEKDDFVDESDSECIISRNYGLFELTTDLSLTFRCFSELPNYTLSSIDADLSALEEDNRKEKNHPTHLHFRSLSKKNVTKLLDFLVEPEEIFYDQSLQIQSIQEYAYSLGEGARKFDERSARYFSLLDISSTVPKFIEDVAEFDLMIEQLSSFYEQKGITMSSLVNRFLQTSSILDSVEVQESERTHANDIFELLYKAYYPGSHSLRKYNSINGLIKLAILLTASLIKTKPREISNQLRSEYEFVIKKASPKVSNLLGEWNLDATNSSETMNFDSQVTQADIMSSLPSIRIRSNHTSNNSKSKSLRQKAIKNSQSQTPSNLAQFSQLTQLPQPNNLVSMSQYLPSEDLLFSTPESFPSSQTMTPSLSQKRSLGSQGNKPKKKKRKGGFS